MAADDHDLHTNTLVRSPPTDLQRTVVDLTALSDAAPEMALPGPTSASLLPRLSDLAIIEIILRQTDLCTNTYKHHIIGNTVF